jgi:hypothetical protein
MSERTNLEIAADLEAFIAQGVEPPETLLAEAAAALRSPATPEPSAGHESHEKWAREIADEIVASSKYTMGPQVRFVMREEIERAAFLILEEVAKAGTNG